MSMFKGLNFQVSSQTQKRLLFAIALAGTSFLMRITGIYDPLCRLLTDVLISGCSLLHVELIQTSPTSFIAGNELTVIVDPLCTVIPAFLISVPFLYLTRESGAVYIKRLLQFILVASIVNIVRLIIGLWAYDGGASWFLSHEIAYGIYYAVWISYIIGMHRRAVKVR